MDMDYMIFGGGIIAGSLLVMLAMYLIYRRGIALRLAMIILSCVIIVGIMAFVLGKEGATPGRTGITVLIGAPMLVGSFIILIREIVNPIKQVARIAEEISKGDLEQTITVKNKDEIGDMANASTQMIAYLQQMARIADRLARGDLMVSITPQSDKDVLGHAFSQMITNLRSLIGQVQQSADQVAEASQQLNTSSEQAGAASQQVSASIQQIATGTTQQTTAVTGAAHNAKQMMRAADGIARGAQEQAQGVQTTSDLINEMAGIVENVKEITGDAVGKVKEMGTRSKEIGRIVEAIDDIADKTDMLALNAAVEAARAGEHGRGFAVVADQVRKLSEDSKSATRDIADLIERVQVAVNEAIVAMEGAGGVSGGINGAVAELKQKSDGVVAAVDSVSTVVEESTASAEEMAANSQEVTDTMEGIAGIAEENSAAAEEVSASAEEMSAQVEEVVASSEELAALAEELREATAQFQVAGSGIEPKQPGRRPKPVSVPASQQPQLVPTGVGLQDDGYDGT